jgi:hypothetical protein
LPIPAFVCYKKMGHENHKKGLGFIALDPSFPRSRRIVVGAEKPGQRVLCFRGVLLPQELSDAFVTFPKACMLSHVQRTPLGFHGDLRVQRFAASFNTRTGHASSFDF